MSARSFVGQHHENETEQCAKSNLNRKHDLDDLPVPIGHVAFGVRNGREAKVDDKIKHQRVFKENVDNGCGLARRSIIPVDTDLKDQKYSKVSFVGGSKGTGIPMRGNSNFKNLHC